MTATPILGILTRLLRGRIAFVCCLLRFGLGRTCEGLPAARSVPRKYHFEATVIPISGLPIVGIPEMLFDN